MSTATLRNRISRDAFIVAALAMGVYPTAGKAQCAPTNSARPATSPAFVGSVAEDSSRLGALVGACWGSASLIRLGSPPHRAKRFESSWIDPVAYTIWNSDLPESTNDGALWSGRGFNQQLMAGGQFAFANVAVTLAPQVLISGNSPFPILPSENPVFNDYASPFHSGGASADLPLRFGSRPLRQIDPGQSTVEAAWTRVSAGLSTANMWWGPGIQNALVMSNNAAGIPRLYARTSRPVSSRLGDFEAYWMLGGLLESPYFDHDTRNDLRAISGAVATLRVAFDTGLTIGGARSVYSSVRRFGGIPEHAADVLIEWSRPPSDIDTGNTDQIISLFARWRVPQSRFAVHGEWSKLSLPESLRDLLVEPQERQGFTIGLEWAHPVADRGLLRLQAEATMLEQTPRLQGGEVLDFYTSRQVPQGYTQRGQVIGASIGPGASSQFIGVGFFRGPLQLEINGTRIRREEGSYYQSPARFARFGHDVSLGGEVAARWDSRPAAIEASWSHVRRYAYLFQIADPYAWETALDVPNATLSLRITPHLR